MRTCFVKVKKSGFTFIELMIAVSIFAVIAVTVYATFNTGLSAWRTAEKTQNFNQDIRLALDILAVDLEQAVVYSEETEFTNFEGNPGEISFYSLEDEYRSGLIHPELKKIVYSLDETGHSVQRKVLTFAESLQKDAKVDPEAIALEVNGLRFAYCYADENGELPYKWKNSWDYTQKGIPIGVRIELESMLKDEPVFTKYVFIPTGEKGKDQ